MDKATVFEPIAALYAVGLGKGFQVACIPPTGFPPPVLTWSRNGQRLPSKGRVR